MGTEQNRRRGMKMKCEAIDENRSGGWKGRDKESEQRTRGAGGEGIRDGGRVKKEWKKTKLCFFFLQKNPGHLVRWNYISDAHAALMLLPHQHRAQAEMVYVCACGWSLQALKVRFWPWHFYPKSETPYPYWALICIIPLSICYSSRLREVSMPINACSNCAKRKKETLRGLGVANVRNYYLT